MTMCSGSEVRGVESQRSWLVGGLVLLALLTGCERPPVDSMQRGYRGTGMVQINNPRTIEARGELNATPAIADPARQRPNAPTAGAVYQNVTVLSGLSIAEFGRTMDAITQWVAPEASCAYCHVEGNFADDGKYTKVVARRMLQMVQNLNGNWQSHVGATGVTCYTCHRGQPLPAQSWFLAPPSEGSNHFIGNLAGQNAPSRVTGLASLPNEVYKNYLQSEASLRPVRVAGGTALPVGKRASMPQAESTYGLMMHMSNSLGVNCTYCHNSRAFASWSESSPQRTTAWHGLRMVREANTQYLSPLSGAFPEIPAGRLGPTKDAAKLHCGTCHQGASKPLYGAQMAKHYPGMLAPVAVPAAPGQAAPGAKAASVPAPG